MREHIATTPFGRRSVTLGQIAGESLEKARVVLERAGKKISEVFVVVDFQSPRFTQSGASSANITYEGMRAFRAFVEAAAKADPDEQPAWTPPKVPMGVAVFAADNSIRGVVEQLMPNIEHWSEFDRGGHFAAMEAPDLLAADVRKFFRGLR